MILNGRDRDTTKFAKLLANLDGASLLGLTRVLGVKVFYDDVKDKKGKPQPRSGESIIEDCLVKFHSLSRPKRRQILLILINAKKEK